MGKTKNQHFVSRGILKHFADDQKKTYELYIEKNIISKKAIDNVMAQNYVYEHPALRANSLENFFARIESQLISWLDKVLAVLEHEYEDKANCEKFVNDMKK